MSTDTLIKSTAPVVKTGTFTVNGALLYETAAVVAKATVATAKVSNLFAAIQLAFKDQRVTVSANNFDVAASVKLPVKGKKATIVNVEAARLVAFAKALKGEDAVEINVTAEEVTLVAGDTVFHLPPVNDFAALIYPVAEAPAALDLAAFQKAVQITSAAASTDEARPILTGIYFHEVDGVSTAVATDSYKLAVTYEGPAGVTGLVPAAAAKLASAVFDGTDEVTFETIDNGKYLMLRSAMKVVKIRLLDGEFPNYASLIRKTHDSKVLVSRAQLVDALDKVRIASDGGTIPASVVVVKGVMHLAVNNPDRGSANDEVELTSGSKSVPSIGLNPLYAVQLLKAVGSDNVQIGYVDSFKPMVFTDGSDDPTWKLLLMPVRIPGIDKAPAPAPKKDPLDGPNVVVKPVATPPE